MELKQMKMEMESINYTSHFYFHALKVPSDYKGFRVEISTLTKLLKL